MKNKICVYAICKNELKFVDKWLANMSEADYIVVLDTGSTDGTYEALQKDPRVTRVEQQVITPWRFDVARNESMKLIPEDANILVCTDFDELFNEGWAKVVRSNWKPDLTRMYYSYAWSHTPTGVPTDVFKYDKIHDRGYYWKYPVHEVLWVDTPNYQKIVDLGDKVFLHHYQDTSKPRSSYFDLLKLSVEENPTDAHVKNLFAREYLLNKQYKEALEQYLQALDIEEINTPIRRFELLDTLSKIAEIYIIEDNYDEAIWYAHEFIKVDATYREPYLTLSKVYNAMEMPTLAKAMVECCLKYCNKKDSWVERADTWTYLPYEQMARAETKLGNLDSAVENINKALDYYPDDMGLLKEANQIMRYRLSKKD